MRIKIDPADRAFSEYIRTRDKRCARCQSPVEFNPAGRPKSHQASHYFGRGRENTRYDPENVDTLCAACHRIWGSDDREAYRCFKIKQLGPEAFNELMIRANITTKKDRAGALIYSRELLKELR